MDKIQFLSQYGITEQFSKLEISNPNLWSELVDIRDDYDIRKTKKLNEALNNCSTALNCNNHIHSIRTRIKDADSLLLKIINKKLSDTTDDNKYNNINITNYYKIITDLVGIRIIIRYRNEWKFIHQLLWDKYHNENKNYLVNYEKDYKKDDGCFISEKPIIYYRHGEDRKNYEVFGRETFDIKLSDIGYSSIHYIVNYYGIYIEIQVRTIYDEAWSECDHDFVYKLNPGNKKLILQRCSKMLSQVTGVADTMSTFISDYYNDSVMPFDDSKTEYSSDAKDKRTIVSNLNKICENQRVNMSLNTVSDILNLF